MASVLNALRGGKLAAAARQQHLLRPPLHCCCWVVPVSSQTSSSSQKAAALKLIGANGELEFCNRQFCHDAGQYSRPITVVNRKYQTIELNFLRNITTASESDKRLAKLTDELIEPEFHFRERFIPITRRSLIRHLMQEKDFLMEDEKKIFERFSLGIDGAVVNKYHGILQELKMLFDPINPDKDTITTRQWNQRERIDNEFWLLQKLSHIMEKANFHELAKPTIHKALAEHSTREGVMVSVNPDKYDVLRFWALGKETPKQIFPWYKRIFYRLSGRPVPVPLEYYKRIVAAVRLRKDSKLILKMFKEVPINALEQLLPDGKIKMTKFDQGILTLTISIGMIGVMVKFVTMLAHFHVQWSLIMTGAAVLVAARSWTVYKNKRNLYLADLNRMLYYKNLANNRGLLTLLVDRAEDESFKEALLAYTFLLTRRPPSSLQQASDSESLPAEIGGIPTEQLEYLVENWISEKAGVRIEFDSEEAVNVLKGFGLLSEVDDKLFVLPLETASRHLPQQPESIILRDDEIDDIEGYDREKYRETETKLKDEEKKARRFGWF